MALDNVKRSVGTLKQSTKAKPRSPDCTGTIRKLRHTLEELCDQFANGNGTYVEANLAGWRYQSGSQSTLNVELSPVFVAPQPATLAPGEDVFGCFKSK